MKKGIIISIIAVIVLTVIACIALSNTYFSPYEKQIRLAYKYLDEGNYEEAILAFDKAIQIDAKKPKAYIGKAEAFVARCDEKTGADAAITLKNGYEQSAIEKVLLVQTSLDLAQKLKDAHKEFMSFDLLNGVNTLIHDNDLNLNSVIYLREYIENNEDVNSEWLNDAITKLVEDTIVILEQGTVVDSDIDEIIKLLDALKSKGYNELAFSFANNINKLILNDSVSNWMVQFIKEYINSGNITNIDFITDAIKKTYDITKSLELLEFLKMYTGENLKNYKYEYSSQFMEVLEYIHTLCQDESIKQIIDERKALEAAEKAKAQRKVYTCNQCGTRMTDAYYDMMGRYFCAPCAKSYFAPFDYRNFRVDVAKATEAILSQ